ncbi:hypothetical protein DFJ73DRAFT_826531 [Zopfochytrium polystomum]|nr:hypothetical protein DFJ73DRAFT_826531 [Zopfochytrium polystomum]
MQGRSTHDMFLSYRVACDLDFVNALYDHCSAAESAAASSGDIHPYLDHHCLVPGRPWEDGFLRGLASAPLVFLVVSNASASSLRVEGDNVFLEWECALDRFDDGACSAVVPLFVDYRDIDLPSDQSVPAFSRYMFVDQIPSFPDEFHKHPRSPNKRTLRGTVQSIASLHSISVVAVRVKKSTSSPTNVLQLDVRSASKILGAVARDRRRSAARYLSTLEENELKQFLLPGSAISLQISQSQLVLEPCPSAVSSELYQWARDPNSELLQVDEVDSVHPHLITWLETALLQSDLLVSFIDLTGDRAAESTELLLRQIVFDAAQFAPEFGRNLLLRSSSTASISELDLSTTLVESIASCVSVSTSKEGSEGTAVVIVLRFDSTETSHTTLRSVMANLVHVFQAVPEFKVLLVRPDGCGMSSDETPAILALEGKPKSLGEEDDGMPEWHKSKICVAGLLVEELLSVPPVSATAIPHPARQSPSVPPIEPNPNLSSSVAELQEPSIEFVEGTSHPDFVICVGAEADTRVAQDLLRSFGLFTTGGQAVAIQPTEKTALFSPQSQGSMPDRKGVKPVYLFVLSNTAVQAICNGRRGFLEQISQGLAASKDGSILLVPVLVEREDDPFSFALVGNVRNTLSARDPIAGALDALLKIQGERLNPLHVETFIARVFQIRQIALDLEFSGLASSNHKPLSGDEVELLRGWLAPASDENAAERARLLKQHASGTRGRLLAEVESFLAERSDSAKRVIWIKGQAGVGKSVLSALLADTLQRRNHLGAAFFCKVGDARRGSAQSLIRTMAFSLCQWSPAFARYLLALRNASDSDPTSPFRCSPALLFSRLVASPMREVLSGDASSAIVLLIDALDECGSADARGDLLSVFATGLKELPRQARVIVTSRLDGDIAVAMAISAPLEREIIPSDADGLMDASTVAIRGVRAITERIGSLGLPSAASIRNEDIATIASTLVEKSGGLLVWLAVAVRLLDELVTNSTSVAGPASLAAAASSLPVGLVSIQASVFGRAFGHRSSPRLTFVVGVLAVAREPLTAAQIAAFGGMTTVQAEYCLLRLRAVLANGDAAATFNHKSVADYLTGNDCTDRRFHVNPAKQHLRIAALLVNFLNSTLKTGVSHISSSGQASSDRVRGIDRSLSYACRMWSAHLLAGSDHPTLSDSKGRMRDLLVSGLLEFAEKHLLHWIEAMAALQCYDELGSSVINAQSFLSIITTAPSDSALNREDRIAVAMELFSDALRVLQRFRTPIMKDPMQVYITAIPLCPVDTRLFRTYAEDTFSRPDRSVFPSADDYWIVPLFPVLPPMSKWDAFRCAEDVGERAFSIEFATTLASPATAVSHKSVNPTARRLLAASLPGCLKIFEVLSGGLLHQVLDAPTPLAGQNIGLVSPPFALSRHGTRMALFERNEDNAAVLAVWNPTTGSSSHMYELIRTEAEADEKKSGAIKQAAKAVKDGWRKLWRGKATINEDQLNHESALAKKITVLRFTNNEVFLLAGTEDGCLVVWDVRDAHVPRLIGYESIHSGTVHDIVITSSDSEVCTASADGTVKILKLGLTTSDAVTSNRFFQSLCDQAVPGVVFLSLSLNGKQLLTSGGGRITLWSLHKDTDIATLQHFKDIPATDERNSLAIFSPQSNYIAVRSQRSVQLWDAAANSRVGEVLQARQYGFGGAVEFAFSDDEEVIATSADVGTVTLWAVKDAVETFADAATGAVSVVDVRCDFLSKTELAEGVSLHPLTASLSAASRRTETRSSSAVFALDFSDSARYLAATDGARLTRMWDIDSGDLVLRSVVSTGNIWRPTPSVYVAKDMVWTHPLSGDVDQTASAHAFLFADDRKERWTRVAVAENGSKFVYLSRSTVRVVSIPQKTIVAEFQTPIVDVVALSPDGRTIAIAGPSGDVLLWETDSGRPVGTFHVDPEQVNRLKTSLESLLADLEKSNAREWNAVEAKEASFAVLRSRSSGPRAVVFAPPATTGTNRLVFTLFGANVLVETHIAAGLASLTRLSIFNDPINDAKDFSSELAFSADGRTLVNLCVGTVKVWSFDAATAATGPESPPPRLAATIRIAASVASGLRLLAPDASYFSLADGSAWETFPATHNDGHSQSEQQDHDACDADRARCCVVRLDGGWLRLRGRAPMWLPQGLRKKVTFDPSTGRLALGGTELVGVWRL